MAFRRPMKVKRAAKYGFCSGVRIADLKVKRFAAGGGKGAILGQVVHNERVVEEMEHLGVRTVEQIDGRRRADHRLLRARCAAVVSRGREDDRAEGPRHDLQVRLRHPSRVEGRAGQRLPPHLHRRSEASRGGRLHPRPRPHDATTSSPRSGTPNAIDWSQYPKLKIFYQTTLNAEEFEDVVKAIEARSQAVERADTICYATKENQDAARVLAHDPEVEVIVVIGGKKSANTKHLWEICREAKRSYLVQGADDLDPVLVRRRRRRRPHRGRLHAGLRGR